MWSHLMVGMSRLLEKRLKHLKEKGENVISHNLLFSDRRSLNPAVGSCAARAFVETRFSGATDQMEMLVCAVAEVGRS